MAIPVIEAEIPSTGRKPAAKLTRGRTSKATTADEPKRRSTTAAKTTRGGATTRTTGTRRTTKGK